MKKAETADIRIALIHHPFDWLQENDDTQSVELLLRKDCHFILHGHLHKPNVINESTLAGETIIIPAGAVYDKRKSPNSYNFVRLDLKTGKGTVYLRRYNDERQEWQNDALSTGDKLNGRVPFDLPKEVLIPKSPITAPKDDHATLLRCYLQSVVEEYQNWQHLYVELEGQTTEIPESEERVHLPDFIEPFYVEHIKKASGQPQQVRLESLSELVDKEYDVMLLGEPGSGKTTALKRIALKVAEETLQSEVSERRLSSPAGRIETKRTGEVIRAGLVLGGESEGRIPILLSLSSLRQDDVEGWMRQGCESLEPYIDGYLQAGKCIFLWDALNEMPFLSKEEYNAKLNALTQFMADYPDNRFIWSCRRLDYRANLPLHQVEILPLDDEKIRAFFHNLSKSGETEACDALLKELETREGGFGELFRRPLMLELLCVVYYQARRAYQDEAIPQSPGKLFAEFVDKLMRREQRGEPLPKISPKVQQDALGQLAFAMMDIVQPSEDVKARSGTTVPIDIAKSHLPETCTDAEHYSVSIDPDELLDVAVGENIIEFLSNRSQLRFWHQSLQEYFAALELQKRLDAGEDLTRILQPPCWYEHEAPAFIRTNELEPLPPPDSTGWEETLIMLAGIHPAVDELICCVLPQNPILAGRCLDEGLDDKTLTRLEGIKADVVDALVETVENPKVALRVQLAAGYMLGRLGDLRIPDPKDIEAMIEIPQGEFLRGCREEDKDTYEDEKPQRAIFLDAYRIDKYPVTNAQYRKFIEATGHREPASWHDKEFNQPNQPVVRVYWYDAMAYAEWTEKRLPTEAEWEKAARGGLEGKKFPWGDEEPDEKMANYDFYVGKTSPVGSYPPNGYGLYDMAGNVWEWCLDEYQADFYKTSPGENPLAGGKLLELLANYKEIKSSRVLRGGSWNYYPTYLRVACRLRIQSRVQVLPYRISLFVPVFSLIFPCG